MLLEAVWRHCENDLFPAASTDDLFNPYRDRVEGLDLPDAPAIRRANLRAYLEAYERRPRYLLLAEAPGPWGCRFSGVPLVSEAQLADDAFPIHGRPTSLEPEPHREYSAGIYWRVLRDRFPEFFTWNTVPLHPHRAGAPLTIRTPRAAEVRAWTTLVQGVVEAVRPERVLAIGRKAEGALARIGVEATYVRHPSQGGARLFEAGVRGEMGW